MLERARDNIYYLTGLDSIYTRSRDAHLYIMNDILVFKKQYSITYAKDAGNFFIIQQDL